MVVQSQPELPKLVPTLVAPCRFSHRVDRGQHDTDENADDGDHYEEFHKSECGASFHGSNLPSEPEKAREIGVTPADDCIIVIPLLLETQQSDLVDRILVIDIPETIQLSRTAARDSLTREEIQAIIDAQAARETRLLAADDIIDNSGGLEDLESRVLGLHERYLEMATGQSGNREDLRTGRT